MARDIFIICQYLMAVISLNVAQCETFRHERIYVFEPTSRLSLQASLADWQREAQITVAHSDGNLNGGYGSFAQSFVPHSDEIQAVQLRLSPAYAKGWVRIELTVDNNGMPGMVFARSWIRFDGNVPLQQGDYLTVPLMRTAVEPEMTYWITFVEYRDKGYKNYDLVNIAGSSTATYAEGKFVLPSGSPRGGIADVDFRIIARASAVPGLEEVSELMKGALPAQPCQTLSWQVAFQECNKTGPVSKKGPLQ